MLDQMEEIPASLRTQYDRSMKIMEHLRKALELAYQSQMELKRKRW
jgi:hypothetical protein